MGDYRYYDDLVRLEALTNKGLRYEDVAPAEPVRLGRPRPGVPFAVDSRKPGETGSIKRQQVRVHLLEEAGVARRRTPVTFGFPLPEGGVFDLSQLRVLTSGSTDDPSTDGDDVPAQFTATAFWPDDSLKWVLVDFAASLGPGTEAEYVLEFGSDVRRTPTRSRLRAEESDTEIHVVTGPLKVTIDKVRFNIFRSAFLDRNKDGRFSQNERTASSTPEGLRMVDEHGRLFTLADREPDDVRIEERGPRKVVVRVAGKYAAADGTPYMEYIIRLTFREDSPRVTVQHTHIDTYLKTEFTDITSLTMPLAPAAELTRATVLTRGEQSPFASRVCSLKDGSAFKVFQRDEQSFVLSSGGEKIGGAGHPGVVLFEGPDTPLGVVVHELRQRWPKAIEATAKEIVIGILPEQPDPLYGRDMPHYLQFPLCEGKYRFKWGMSFSTRVTVDFSGGVTPEELSADADMPVVPVLPASWYAATRALGRMAAPMNRQFTRWDEFVRTGYAGHIARKKMYREYGYFNYGDWYGERGRNWGNNEYDLAHGLFMQFARTGNRDYYRLALAAARHQADTDCVHAYPDPQYVGANHEHSIGHTGTWSQHPPRATWSYAYSGGTWAGNGHTWAEGMMEAWLLAGDARVMEACLGLGEHIAWAFAPNFHRLSTHERTAGWSLLAAMAIYHGTSDPVYLEAAERIAAVPLREQKFDEGGAWPHKLPAGHSGGHTNAYGNNLFLIGILLTGLSELHEATQDPALEKSIIAGARWVTSCFDEQNEAWPYSAAVDATPLYARCSVDLNALMARAVAYAGTLSGEPRFVQVAEAAFARGVRGRADAEGKALAMSMVFAPATLSLLQEWYASHRPDKGAHVLDGSFDMAQFTASARDARHHSVRAPDEKHFYVKVIGAVSELVATRQPHGGMQKDWERGSITVHDSAGAVVKQGTFSTDGAHEFRAQLESVRPGAEYKVVVRDDQRGVWNLSGEGLQIVMEALPGFRIGGVGRCKFYFHVPPGVQEFRVKLLGVHQGEYGGAVLTPDGKIAKEHQGVNITRTYVKGAPGPKGVVPDGNPERGEMCVRPAATDTGKVWSLVLWAAGDIGCELEGVPAYLAVNRESLFVP